jgi:hypothetical protein
VGYFYAGWRGIMKIDSSGEFQWKKNIQWRCEYLPVF